VQCHILDSRLQPVPVGVPGELCLAGVALGRGYWNRPDLTAEKFVPNPYSTIPGDRLYLTGDAARYRADGAIEFLARLDGQVKIRGFRVEPAEVESALCDHPSVKEAVVVLHEDARGDRGLVAYVVPHGPSAPTPSALRSFLAETLPSFMVPSRFVPLDALPLTNSGKVDRRSLPALDQSRPELDSAYVAPESETEHLVATAWREVLGVDRVGLDDNFFDLGGHSLLLVQVHAALSVQVALDLTILDLFRYPTVRSLARHLSGSQEGVTRPQGDDRSQARAEGRARLLARARQRQSARAEKS
jgi:hypothetical protein